MKQKKGKINKLLGDLYDIIAFGGDCLKELVTKKERKDVRGNVVRPNSFASFPNSSVQGNNKGLLTGLLASLKPRKRVQAELYLYSTKKSSRFKRVIPFGVITLALTLFLSLDCPRLIGKVFDDIGLFKIKTVTLHANDSETEERLRQNLGITLYRTSLLSVRISEIQKRLSKDPWVSEVKVTRNWPAGLVVKAKSHRPIAMMNTSLDSNGQSLYYVNETGVPFLRVTPGGDVDFPVITGVNTFSRGQERTEVMKEIREFLLLVRRNRNNVNLPAQSVSEIHVNDRGELVVYLVDHAFPIFFGKGKVKEKYRRLKLVLAELYKEQRRGFMFSGVEYIRMEYLNDKVLVAQSESG